MLAVAAMVACSNEHTVEVAPQNNAIDFTTHVDKATRVATDITKDNIANFGVYASVTNTAGESALILQNEKVTKSGEGENAVWGYGNTQYWVPGNSYNFVAIAPYDETSPGPEKVWSYSPRAVAQAGIISFNNGVAPRGAGGEVDLVYAYAQRNNVAAGAQAKVSLTFNHLLSKVAFKFTNGFAAANNISFEVKDLKVNNTVQNAQVNVTDGVVGNWTATDNNDLVRAFPDECGILTYGQTYVTEHYYLIPVAKEYNITFSIDVYQANVKVAKYDHAITTAINFEKGCNYSINATFTPENINPNAALDKIDFDVVKVEEWNNADVALEVTEVATAEEFAAAIAAGENVELTQNISVENGLTVQPVTRAANFEMSVNLNGKTLTYTGNDVLFRVNGATLSIFGDGAIVTNPTTYGGDSAGNGYVALVKDNGTVNFYGGSYDAQATCTIAQVVTGAVNVYAGEFQVDMKKYTDANGNAAYLLNCTDANWKNGTADINVYGGSFYKFNPADNAAETAGTNFVAEGKTVVKADDWYTVQ